MSNGSKTEEVINLPLWRKILNLILILGFLGCMVGVVTFSLIGKKDYGILMVGLLFLFAGILALLSSKLTDRNAWILIFPVMGVVITLLSLYHLANPKEDIWRYGLPAGAGMMAFFALVMCLCSPVYRFLIKKRYTEKVNAACIDLKEDYTRNESSGAPKYVTVFSPVYQFHYSGKDYTVCEENYYSNMGIPKVGDTRELLIDPLKPEDFYVKKRGNFIGNIVFTIAAVLLGAAMYYAYYITYVHTVV